MTIENPINKKEIDLLWTATAERYNKKIDDRLDEILKISPEGNEHTAFLDTVKDKINQLFSNYENKGYTVSLVEEDLKHMIDNAENEEDKKVYETILNFVQVKEF